MIAFRKWKQSRTYCVTEVTDALLAIFDLCRRKLIKQAEKIEQL